MKWAAPDEFLGDPVGRWSVVASSVLVFFASPTLGGCVAWGRPSLDDTRRVLEVFEAFRHPTIAPRFDVVVDGRGVQGVDPEALAALVGWLDAHKGELTTRVRLQLGVVDDTMVGFALSGILPVLGDTHSFRIVRDRRAALRALTPDADALSAEIDACVAHAGEVAPALRALRAHLRGRLVDASIESAAKGLHVSPRTLQRVLREGGTTFRSELKDARFGAARELLVQGDDKISSIAARVGLSDSALAALVREKSGATPAELRKRSR